MTGPITRKIALSQQLEEARALLGEPAPAATMALQAERTERRRAIVKTLEWNRDHEHLIRLWLGDTREGGIRLRIRRGQPGTISIVDGQEVFVPLDVDAFNSVLARFDPPEGT